MSQDSKNAWIVAAVVILAAVLYFKSQGAVPGFSIFQPSTNSPTQYTSNPDTYNDNSWAWVDSHPLPLSFTDTAKLGDYTIKTYQAKSGTKYGPPYCAGNSCSGTPAGTDSFGCQVFNGISGEQQICSKSCSGSLVCSADCNPYPSNGVNCRSQCSCGGGSYLGDPCGPKINCFIGSGTATGTVTTYCQLATTCGGQKQDVLYSSSDQCWEKAEVFYQGNLIKTIDWDNQLQSAYFDKNNVVTQANSRLNVYLLTGQQYIAGACKMVVNEFSYTFKTTDFIINLTTPNSQVFKDQDVIVNIEIQNNYGETVDGQLAVKFEVPTTIGVASKIDIKNLSIAPGKSIQQFTIPTTQVTDKIIVTPTLDILSKGSNFDGVNGICYQQESTQYPTKEQSLASCAFVKLGTVNENPFTINIIPNPLYVPKPIGGTCPNGYTQSLGDSSLCVRNDIKDLSCSQLGCPTIAGHTYQCTSSGFCAETVFQQAKCLIDSNCPSGTKCEASSGLCIKTEIYDNLIQCGTANDCITPCSGIVKSCVSNVCAYQGACDVTTVYVANNSVQYIVNVTQSAGSTATSTTTSQSSSPNYPLIITIIIIAVLALFLLKSLTR